MAETSSREVDGGKVALAYDPAIGDNFARGRLRCRHVGLGTHSLPNPGLRGESSDLLLSEHAEEMTRRGRRRSSSKSPAVVTRRP